MMPRQKYYVHEAIIEELKAELLDRAETLDRSNRTRNDLMVILRRLIGHAKVADEGLDETLLELLGVGLREIPD